MKAGRIFNLAVAAVSLVVFVSAASAADTNQGKARGRVKPGEVQGFVPQPEPPGDRVNAQTQAWLHGIPGQDIPGGIIVQISSHPGDRRATVMIKGNEAALKSLRSLQERKARTNLKLVVRQNPGDKQDTVYNLGDARIDAIKGDGAQTSSISLSFDRMSKVAGAGYNPGVPPGTPAILPSGINKGWVHFAETKDPNGVPVDVVAYTEPGASGQMKLTFKGSDTLLTQLKGLHADGKGVDMLILMLPDVKTGRYVEYKLAKASVGSLTDSGSNMHKAVFNSAVIDCFTGTNSE